MEKEEPCLFCEGRGQVVSSTTISGFKTCDCINIPQEESKQELLPDFKIAKNIFDFVTDLSDTKKEEPKQDKWEQLRGEGLDQPLTSWDEIKQHVGLINDNIDEFDKAAQEYFERKSKFKQDLNDAIHEAHQTGRAMKQEESKQECTCDVCDNCEEQETTQILKEAKERALKQKTLEEAAISYAVDVNTKMGGNKEAYQNCSRLDFIAGAKWQAENMPIHILGVDNNIVQIKDGVVIVEKNDKSKRSYSEEDVINALHSVELKDNKNYSKIYEGMKEWFEKNKKQQ